MNGGYGPTQQPRSTSPLLDAGSCANLAIDQRGTGTGGQRAIDLPGIVNTSDGCDIGSVELQVSELPVELTNLKATQTAGEIILTWATLSEENNAGFYVEQREGGQGDFESLGFLNGKGNSVELQNYSYTIPKSLIGKLEFRLRQIDFDGTISYSPVVEINTDLPAAFAMTSPYPNPFATEFNFSLQVASEQHVVVNLYAVDGRLVRSVLDEEVEANSSVSRTLKVGQLSPGVYLLYVKGETFESTSKVVVTK